MFIWAGIDEAGYGPLLGPLVVAGTCFETSARPGEGCLWELLSDSLTDAPGNLDGRLRVADSKVAYSRRRGLKHLEESVLCFLSCIGHSPRRSGELLSILCPHLPENTAPWFNGAVELELPIAGSYAAIESKSATLADSLDVGCTSFLYNLTCPVLPLDYNRAVSRTGNKSMLLWQKCGILLKHVWRQCDGREGFVLVDRHGGRRRYRELLCEAFPECECRVQSEEQDVSLYRLRDGSRSMWVAFKNGAEQLSLPVALASMTAKYVRELYMLAFNSYWNGRREGLRPTAGYGRDARRFLNDIRPLLEENQTGFDALARMS